MLNKRAYIFCAVLLAIILAGCASADSGNSRPIVMSYTVDDSNVTSGTTITLSWEVEGADTIEIDNGVGQVPARGSMVVKPAENTAYNLTATNRHGVMVSTLLINVVPVIQVASPPAIPVPPDREPPVLAENEANVWYKGAVMVGADGHWITLRNKPGAHNPTWAELMAFLKQDNTDKQPYVQGKFTCGDFAEMLHNNAEAAGLRAAIAAVVLRPAGLAEGVIKHSLDAFETTDKGTVCIDATSSAQGLYADKIVQMAPGGQYVPVSLENGRPWSDMGRIEAIEIFQW